MRKDLAEYLDVAAPSDFFQLLNLDLGATPLDVKASYRALQRLVHPDLIGECQQHDNSILQLVPLFCQAHLRPLKMFPAGGGEDSVACLAGDAANELAVILNIAYSTLMDDSARDIYVQDVRAPSHPPLTLTILVSSSPYNVLI